MKGLRLQNVAEAFLSNRIISFICGLSLGCYAMVHVKNFNGFLMTLSYLKIALSDCTRLLLLRFSYFPLNVLSIGTFSTK